MSKETEQVLSHSAEELSLEAQELAEKVSSFAAQIGDVGASTGSSFFISALTVFILACFVGYYVVWRVTPALHSPLMGITNAISSVIIVGALIAAGPEGAGFSKWMGFFAIILASINIVGGFIVTQRMLSMFKKKA